MAFCGGVRSCIGRRFGQVEFVAVVATLLRRHRVELLRCDGETVEEAARRAWRVVLGSVSLPIFDMPADVGVVLVERTPVPV